MPRTTLSLLPVFKIEFCIRSHVKYIFDPTDAASSQKPSLNRIRKSVTRKKAKEESVKDVVSFLFLKKKKSLNYRTVYNHIWEPLFPVSQNKLLKRLRQTNASVCNITTSIAKRKKPLCLHLIEWQNSTKTDNFKLDRKHT